MEKRIKPCWCCGSIPVIEDCSHLMPHGWFKIRCPNYKNCKNFVVVAGVNEDIAIQRWNKMMEKKNDRHT
jgi:hypothetical protein